MLRATVRFALLLFGASSLLYSQGPKPRRKTGVIRGRVPSRQVPHQLSSRRAEVAVRPGIYVSESRGWPKQSPRLRECLLRSS